MNKQNEKDKVETNHHTNNIKINYIKSLIENKLRGVTQTWGHNNLNSKRKNNKSKKEEDESKEFIEIAIKIPDEELTFTTKVEVIYNLKEVDLLQWFEDFETIKDQNAWNEKTTGLILRNLIKDKDVDNAIFKDSFASIKNGILKTAYPKEVLPWILKKLEKVFQKNFVYIKDYVDELEKWLKIYVVSANITKSEYARRLDELFFRNLGMWTKDQLMKLEKDDSRKEAINYLIKLEKKIENQGLEESLNNFNISKGKDNVKKDTIPQNVPKENFQKNSNGDLNKGKTVTHERHAIMIQETRDDSDIVYTNVEVNETKISALIDTGSSRSVISKSVVQKLKLGIEKVEPIKLVVGNNEILTMDEIANVSLKIGDGLSATEKCYVSNCCPEDLVLGNDFLKNQGCVINFRNMTLTSGKTKIQLVSRSEQLGRVNEVDKLFFSKFDENQVFEPDDVKLNKMIQEYYNELEPGKGIKMKPVIIKLSENRITTKFKNYSVAPKFVNAAKEELERLRTEDIIEESDSLTVSPAFLILKKNLKVRLVVDYREINQYIIDEICMIPKMLESLASVGENVVFSQLDLRNGFNQIPLDESSRDLTAFVLMNRQYRYKRVPFGLKQGPKLFQKVITQILGDVENCFVYIDDIVVFAKDREHHDRILEEVLTRLRKWNVELNLEKSDFFLPEANMLGFKVSSNGIEPDLKHLDNKIFEQKITTKKHLQKLIGVLNWYRPFIKDLSNKIAPITELLKIENFVFTKEHWDIVNQLREGLTQETLLKFPDYSKGFKMDCDASDIGIGCVLYQEHGVIGYFSKKLNKSEMNYSIVEKEMYSINKGILFFRNHVQGNKIEVFTDNKNCFVDGGNISSRMYRWKLQLMDFNVEIKSIEGKENVMADLLSRMCLYKEKRYSRRKAFKKYVDELKVGECNLTGRIMLNIEKEKEFIRHVHVLSGHAGISGLYRNIYKYFLILDIKRKVKEVVEECVVCKESKANVKVTKEYVPITSKGLLEKVSTDVYGPFDLENYNEYDYKNKGYFVTITDVYSRITRVYFTTSVTGRIIVKCFKKWAKRYQEPKTVISDNGTEYDNQEVARYFDRIGVKHVFIPTYAPFANGISERINVSISEVLRMNKGESIKQITKLILFKLNENINRNMGVSPMSIYRGYNFFDIKKERIQYVPKMVIEENRNDVKEGQEVYVKNFNSKKSDKLYLGPFKVEEVGYKGFWIKVKDHGWVHLRNLKL